jgi:hypothetical protein
VLGELAASQQMERSMGLSAEALKQGRAGRLLQASRALAVLGAAGAVVGRRNRAVSAVAGAALLAGSAATRFAIFEAGQESARDPKYTVVPQRERLDGSRPASAG